jgi:polygalacturonase
MSVYDVVKHGAVGDGRTNDAAAIQKAIDACHEAGGGRVLVPAGRTCLCGSIELRSRVELHVERGAVLLGATEETDYPCYAFKTGPEAGKRAWIVAYDAEDVALTGGGVVDGNHRAFSLKEGPYIHTDTKRWRPAMTCLVGCRRIRVRDLTFRGSANWALHFSGCEDVVVDGVSILNDLKFPNCDGIDPDHCRNVRISNCHIEAGDDCIVLKNTEVFERYGPCENVTVTNCTLVSTSSAIKIGTESLGDFRNLVFQNCVIRGSHRGLSIQIRDWGNVENVIFSNMTVETRFFEGGWWGSAECIYVTALPRTPETKVGRLRNILFTNLFCRGENGVFVMGASPEHVADVAFDNIRLQVGKWSRWEGGRYDVRPCPPSIRPNGSVPIGKETPWGTMVRRNTPAVYVENATRVRFHECSVEWAGELPPYYTHALEAIQAPGLVLDGFRGDAAHPDRHPSVRIG